MNDHVMHGESLKQYVFDRKLATNKDRREEQLQNLRRVILYNAQRQQEVADKIGDAVAYFPPKSTEQHFYDRKDGTIHVCNPRGVTRAVRDEQLVSALSKICGREIEFVVEHYDNDAARASKRFEDFACDTVHGVFSVLREEMLRQSRCLHVLMGPHASLGIEEDSDHALFHEDEFLNYTVLKINGAPVIAFDYIFADQARNVLGQVYSTVDAYFKGMDIAIYHYGKYGILNDRMNVGDICIPVSALEEREILTGYLRTYPIHNQLQGNHEFLNMPWTVHTGTTVNTTSVLEQRMSTLQKDKSAGGDFLDMELLLMASLGRGYPRLGDVKLYAAGVGSDKPLDGRTLGDTVYPREREMQIVQAYKRIITNDLS